MSILLCSQGKRIDFTLFSFDLTIKQTLLAVLLNGTCTSENFIIPFFTDFILNFVGEILRHRSQSCRSTRGTPQRLRRPPTPSNWAVRGILTGLSWTSKTSLSPKQYMLLRLRATQFPPTQSRTLCCYHQSTELFSVVPSELHVSRCHRSCKTKGCGKTKTYL